MKRVIVILVAAAAVAAAWVYVSNAGRGAERVLAELAESQPPAQQAWAGVAVVELYTSEGCSSCPPADRVLAALVDYAAETGTPIYPLAFHVDYWDGPTWRDPFSSSSHSARQYAYASAWGSEQVYTPQMIVNGREEFVGSDGKAAARAIEQELARPTVGTLTMTANLVPGEPDGKRGVDVRVEHEGLPDDSEVVIALVERGLAIHVGGGENGGEHLSHENVVRAFDVTRVHDAAPVTTQLEVPDHLVPDRASVIVFAQNRKGREVYAATRTPLIAPEGAAE